MRNFISPHVHVKSLDSASSPEQFAKRELELGTGYLTVTDHGTLEATRQVYDLLKSKKAYQDLKPILGVEGYFRDDSCPILLGAGAIRDTKGTLKEHLKYMHLTLHALNSTGYSALSRVLSAADLRAEVHGHERKPLFTWENLEDLGAKDVTVTSGCLIGMVSRHLLENNDPASAIAYYERLRGTFKPGNFYVEIFPHNCDRNWESKVIIETETGETVKLQPYTKVKTDFGEPVTLETLAAHLAAHPEDLKKYRAIKEVFRRKWIPQEPELVIKSIVHHEGWLLNECRPWAPDGDVQLGCNKFLLELATKFGDPVLISDDSHFAYPEEKVVQDIRLGQLGNWRFANSHHRRTSAEAWEYFRTRMGTPQAQFEGWIENTHAWASRFRSFEFEQRRSLPTTFYPPDTLRHTLELVKRHGRMRWDDPSWVARLEAEIHLLYKNGTVDLLPYFMIDEEVCRLYTRQDLLTGPGRGSAAGLLLTYLLGITHVDPLKFGLSMDRFMTLDRIQTGKLPDIDQDLPTRAPLVGAEEQGGWLQERFGACVSQISTDTTMKLKSAIKDTFRALAREAGESHPKVPDQIEALCKALPNPPQGIPDRDYVFGFTDNDGNEVPGLLDTNEVLKGFVARYPKEWHIVQMLLGLARQKSRHACGFVISDTPISEFIPLQTIGGVRVTSFTTAGVEAAGGLKMDFLVVNSIRDIGSAIKLIQSRYPLPDNLEKDEDGVEYATIGGVKVPKVRLVPFGGTFKNTFCDIWSLPEDLDVFRDICEGKVETVFQFDAAAARMGLRYFAPDGADIPLKSIEGLAAFTALDRPGPLDATVQDANGNVHNMLVEFANRARGKSPVGNLPVLDRLLPETHGVIVYQEQLQAIFQRVGGTTAIEANNFRQRISKKKLVDVNRIDKPLFMRGALPLLGEVGAETLWSQMQTFGQYGFNKSHAVCYVTISYACAWLKHHYPLEWWAAVLSNADRNEIDEKFWAYCGHLIDLPDIQLSKQTFSIQNERIRAPLSLLHGLGEKAHVQLLSGAPYTTVEEFLTKIEDWKVANPRQTKKKNTDELVWVKGISALNNTVIQNLIVSGAMDSLFPAVDEAGLPLTTEERLAIYAFTAKKVTKKKKIESLGTRFNLSSPLVQYQLRKKVLPAFSSPILPLVQGTNPRYIAEGKFLTFFDNGNVKRTWEIVTGQTYDKLLHVGPVQIEFNICVLAYVVAKRTFTYTKKDGESKTACELTLDADGTRVNVVKWPTKDGLPSVFSEDLTGSILACLFYRGEGSDSFFLSEVHVVAPSLTTIEEKEESPDERTTSEVQSS